MKAPDGFGSVLSGSPSLSSTAQSKLTVHVVAPTVVTWKSIA
jgi:hypothetical protein